VSGASVLWGGRPVSFQDFTVKDLTTVRDAFAQNSTRGMWTVLALSAVYADGEGGKVFADADAVEASPARMAQALTRMSLMAMEANGMQSAQEGEGDPPLV
jgi:hypothetical protein